MSFFNRFDNSLSGISRETPQETSTLICHFTCNVVKELLFLRNVRTYQSHIEPTHLHFKAINLSRLKLPNVVYIMVFNFLTSKSYYLFPSVVRTLYFFKTSFNVPKRWLICFTTPTYTSNSNIKEEKYLANGLMLTITKQLKKVEIFKKRIQLTYVPRYTSMYIYKVYRKHLLMNIDVTIIRNT